MLELLRAAFRLVCIPAMVIGTPLMTPAAHGQGTTQERAATLSGVVLDPGGSAIPDAEVIAANTANGLQRSVRTDAEGTFVIPMLPPGPYVVTAQKEGFAVAQVQEIALRANDVTPIRIQLTVGSRSENVIVTAQKRGEERLRDVPVPVTALDAQTLTSNGELRLRDYFSRIPGLSLSPDTQGVQHLAIRGITTGRASIPTVGMLVDDVPYGFSRGEMGTFPDIDPGDLQRVEVLRGPQGTLYGASSMGGLIKYVTVDPSTAGFSGRVAVGMNSIHNGNGVGYNVRASTNIPLSKALAVRASGFTREDPGYIDNPIRGLDGVNQFDARGGSLAALWRPSNALSIKLGALYQDSHADGSSEVDTAVPGLGDLQQNPIIGTGWFDRTVQAYSAVIGARLGTAELTSISGYSLNKYTDTIDGSGAFGATAVARGYGSSATPTDDRARARRFSQELRLSAPLGKQIETLLGVYYTDDRYEVDQLVTVITPTGAVIGAPLIQTDDLLLTYGESAAFANLTYHFTDRFDVQAGGRWSRNTTANERGVNSGVVYGGPSPIPVVSARDNVFTYLLAPRFTLSDNLMVYGRLASGYRPGQPNSPLAISQGAPASFTSDSIRNYEVGVKGSVFENRLAVDASLYHIDWQDVQIRINVLGGFGTNGSGAKSEGVELAFTFRPVLSVTVEGWVACDNAVLTEPLPAGSPVFGVAGDRLPFSSRRSGNLSAEQRYPLPLGLIGFVGGAVSYVGERLSNFQPAGRTRQDFPSYTKVDLRAGVERGRWTIDLSVNNVADTRGVLNDFHYIPGRITYIQPRTVGLTVTRSF